MLRMHSLISAPAVALRESSLPFTFLPHEDSVWCLPGLKQMTSREGSGLGLFPVATLAVCFLQELK